MYGIFGDQSEVILYVGAIVLLILVVAVGATLILNSDFRSESKRKERLSDLYPKEKGTDKKIRKAS